MGWYENRAEELKKATADAVRTGDPSKLDALIQHTIDEGEGDLISTFAELAKTKKK